MCRSQNKSASVLLIGALATLSPVLLAVDVQQRVQNGSIGVVNTGGGTVIIGYTIEQHEKALKERETQLRDELKTLYTNQLDSAEAKRALAERELTDVQKQLSDVHTSYRDRIAALEKMISELNELVNSGGNTGALNDAIAALQRGDTRKADTLFAEIEQNEQTAIERAAAAAYQRGWIANDKLDYRSAYAHFMRAVELGPSNTDYLIAAANVAETIADYSNAIMWNEQAEKGLLALAQPNAATLATVRNNLGEVWQDEGEYDKAIGYFGQALTSNLKTYGAAHPLVAIDWNNLGSAWEDKGEYSKAISYFEQALASDLNTYGETHPSVATDRNNLGSAWKLKGEYDKAIGYFEQALVSDLKTYGAMHPNVATDRNNLGSAWKAKGGVEKAIGYFEQALASDLKTYGDGHPDVAIDRNNLGSAWQDKGDYDKALRYYTLALSSDLKIYGEMHPEVAIDRHNLGLAWQDKGDYGKAISYFEQALEISRKSLGVNHPTTKTISDNLRRARKTRADAKPKPAQM